MGWLIPKQGPNPSESPKIAFFDPNFTFRFPKSHKNPSGWVGKQIWERYPKKNIFFGSFPYVVPFKMFDMWFYIIFQGEWMRGRLPFAVVRYHLTSYFASFYLKCQPMYQVG